MERERSGESSAPGALSRITAVSFPTKLATLITLLIGTISLFVLFYFPTRLERQALEAVVSRVETLGEMTAHSLAPRMASHDVSGVNRVLEAVSQSTDLLYVVVLDRQGEVWTALNEEQAQASDFKQLSRRDQISREDTLYKSKALLVDNYRIVGELYLGFSLEPLQAQMAAGHTTVALVSLVIFALGWIAVRGLSLHLTRPLTQMVATVEQIAQGDLSRRVAVESDDELGDLARSFNAMIERVESTYRKLEEAARTLENRVEERTRELQNQISERRRAEEALQRAYQDLRTSHAQLQTTQLQLIQAEKLESVGQLAAGVAHEVKNPLMTLLLGVKYLEKQVTVQDENVRQLLEDMGDAVQRANTVITGLLDFSAPAELEMQTEDLNEVVERSLALVKHDLDRYRVQAVRTLDANLPSIILDRNKIQQVLVVLFTNAVHAMPEGGQLSVKTCLHAGGGHRREAGVSLADSALTIEVEDTGTGIPEENLGKIFDPFFTTKPTGKGTGLGLSVARQIVQMHGGSLDIRNREAGGARAILLLPVKPDRRRRPRDRIDAAQKRKGETPPEQDN